MRRPGFEPGPPALYYVLLGEKIRDFFRNGFFETHWKAGILATILPAHGIVIKKEVLKFTECIES